MSELFYTLTLIVIIIVLILVFILISYFYNSYDENKTKVNVNFKKTSDYINRTNSSIANKIDNINTNINKLDTKTNNIDSNYTNNLIRTNNYFTSNTSNIINLQSNNSKLFNNINNFDSNLKQFFQFTDNTKTTPNKAINESLFDYRFSTTPNLSMTLLRDINIASSMIINTDTSTKFFKVCDTTNTNCIDLSVNNGNFNIKPSNDSTTINNLNIANKNNQSLANFDFANNAIYLGSNGEQAGMYIKGNKVFVKDLYLLNKGTNYSSSELLYNSNTPNAEFNMYKFDNNLLTSIPRYINIEYNIAKGGTAPNFTYIININILSKYIIPSGLTFTFNIPGLTFITTSKTINNTNATDIAFIPNIILSEQKCTITLGKDIEAKTNKNFLSAGTTGIPFMDATATNLYNKIQVEF